MDNDPVQPEKNAPKPDARRLKPERRALFVCHLHMGGPDGAAVEWRALHAPRFARRLEQMGVTHVTDTSQADVIIITGLLTTHNLEAVLGELAGAPESSVLVAAGDTVIDGGIWSQLGMPGLNSQPLGHYADVHVSVPGDPPTPQALIAALAAAAGILNSR